MDGFRSNDGSLLSVGVVGLGYWGPNLLRGLMELPGVDVSYICDRDEERLALVRPALSGGDADEPLRGPAGRSASSTRS